MKRRLSRTESQQLTRARLVEAAEKIFVRSGFEGASLEEIAETAGFSRGAFYSNFSSKDEIFLELLDRKRREREQAVEAIFHEKLSPEERFHAVRDWYVEQGSKRDWAILEREFHLRALRVPAVRKHLAALLRQELETYAALSAQYIEEAGIPPGDSPRRIALALIGMAQGLSTFSLLSLEPEIENLVHEARQLAFERFIPHRK